MPEIAHGFNSNHTVTINFGKIPTSTTSLITALPLMSHSFLVTNRIEYLVFLSHRPTFATDHHQIGKAWHSQRLLFLSDTPKYVAIQKHSTNNFTNQCLIQSWMSVTYCSDYWKQVSEQNQTVKIQYSDSVKYQPILI